MPNKHFCQGPECHEKPTTDRFLKSRGVIRGRYAYATMDQGPNQWGWTPLDSDKFFCSQTCKNEWLNKNMECVRARTVVPFITHRRESQGYQKVTTTHDSWNGGNYNSNSIQRINGTDN